jgi:hypothetical protein
MELELLLRAVIHGQGFSVKESGKLSLLFFHQVSDADFGLGPVWKLKRDGDVLPGVLGG